LKNQELEQKQSETVLAEALTGFAKIQTQLAENQAEQTASTNKRIDKLSDKMGELVEVMVRSEERHNTHSEKNERLEKNQIELGKEFKDYRKNNDDRIVDIEKQVLLLENDDKSNKENSKDRKQLRNTIIGGVAVVMILSILGIVFGVKP
jgi:hypothetical protein